MKSIAEITKNMTDWQPPVIPENIAHGDMPGDKVEIGEGHVQKANVIFKELLPMLEEASEKSETGKVVITVCGGSGVGKSEIASLLSFYPEIITHTESLYTMTQSVCILSVRAH